MKTLTKEEFEKLYGTEAYKAFGTTAQPESYGAKVGSAFKSSVNYAKQGFEESKGGLTERNPIEMTESGLKIASGALGAALSPVAPIFEPVGQAINYTADKISDNPAVQEFAMSKPGEVAGRVAEDVANTAGLLGLKGAGKAGTLARDATGVASKTARSVGETLGDKTTSLRNAATDIVPTTSALIDHSVAQAFQLAKSDVVNIQKASGNNIGRWIADNNLIGRNSQETIQNVTNFTDEAYSNVRQVIANVPEEYKQYNIPRYVDALKTIKGQIDDVKGLETKITEVDNLLNKEVMTLSDVQRVKELLDEHFDLYKVTGDVKAGATKQGVAQMRLELKQFIEREAKKATGEDLKQMNNTVSTGKSLLRAIETRDAPGLRKWQTLGDFGSFGVGAYLFGGPIGGAALYVVKKIWETPTIQLRFARWLDKLDDAKKAKVRSSLNNGEIPPELDEFVEIVD